MTAPGRRGRAPHRVGAGCVRKCVFHYVEEGGYDPACAPAARARPAAPGGPGGAFPAPALLAGRLAASSVALYTRDCGAYVAFCGYDSTVALRAETLRRWRTYLVQDTPMSPQTINRMLAAVKRVVKEGLVHGLVAREVAEAFAQVEGVSVVALRHRLKAHARVRITPAQMRQLCDAPDPQTLLGLRDRALLHTLAGSGCRITEVVTLTAGQITTRDGGHFLQVLGKRQKGLREAPLSQEALRVCADLAGAAGVSRGAAAAPLFTRFVAGGRQPTALPLSTVSAWRAVRKYALQCGLPQIKPHDFRRFVGTEFAKRNRSIYRYL